MQVIGFNFTKILADRKTEIEKFSITANIEFTDLKKEEVDLLKDAKAIKISFKYSADYMPIDTSKKEKLAELSFNGDIILAVSEEEHDNLLKAWGKKQIPHQIQMFLFNLILKKCSPKAVYLADELNMPSPVQLPKLTSPIKVDNKGNKIETEKDSNNASKDK